jgi:hypothetical protein
VFFRGVQVKEWPEMAQCHLEQLFAPTLFFNERMADRPVRPKGGIKEILCHIHTHINSNATVAMDAYARYSQIPWNPRKNCKNLRRRESWAQNRPDLCPRRLQMALPTRFRLFPCPRRP